MPSRSCTGERDDPRRRVDREPGPRGRNQRAAAHDADAAVIRALLRKELLVELRTLESVPAMSLFAVTTFVVFHFALNRNSIDGDLAAGVLWVTLLFAAMLGVNRLFVADDEQGGFDGFLLAPVERSAMLIAKAARAADLPRRARDRRRAGVRAVAARAVVRSRRCRA